MITVARVVNISNPGNIKGWDDLHTCFTDAALRNADGDCVTYV